MEITDKIGQLVAQYENDLDALSKIRDAAENCLLQENAARDTEPMASYLYDFLIAQCRFSTMQKVINDLLALSN